MFYLRMVPPEFSSPNIVHKDFSMWTPAPPYCISEWSWIKSIRHCIWVWPNPNSLTLVLYICEDSPYLKSLTMMFYLQMHLNSLTQTLYMSGYLVNSRNILYCNIASADGPVWILTLMLYMRRASPNLPDPELYLRMALPKLPNPALYVRIATLALIDLNVFLEDSSTWIS